MSPISGTPNHFSSQSLKLDFGTAPAATGPYNSPIKMKISKNSIEKLDYIIKEESVSQNGSVSAETSDLQTEIEIDDSDDEEAYKLKEIKEDRLESGE